MTWQVEGTRTVSHTMDEKYHARPGTDNGLPSALAVKNPPASAGDVGSVQVGKIPWRRKWQPTPVFWAISWTEEPGRLQFMGSQKSHTHD